MDDVIDLEKTMTDLKALLRDANAWTTDYDMTRAIAQSCSLFLPGPVCFKNELRPENNESCYLGISLGKKPVLQDILLVRLRSAQKMLMNLKTHHKEMEFVIPTHA